MKHITKIHALLALLLIFVFFRTEAQTVQNPERSIKIYANGFVHTSDQAQIVDTASNTLLKDHNRTSGIGTIAPAFNWTEKSNKVANELEISYIRFAQERSESYYQVDSTGAIKQVVGGMDGNSFSLLMRYERMWAIFDNPDVTKFSFRLGALAQPYFYFSNSNPKNSASFRTRHTTIGTYIGAVPRINYQLNDKWYLDLNVPVNFMHVDFSKNVVENPSFTAQQQRNSVLDFRLGREDFSYRIGVGVRI